MILFLLSLPSIDTLENYADLCKYFPDKMQCGKDLLGRAHPSEVMSDLSDVAAVHLF